MPANLIKRYCLQYRTLLLFAIIGGINTLVHSGTVILLVERCRAWPVAANVAGFALANTVSFFANTRLTFRQRPTLQLWRKFFTVSLGSLGLTVALSGVAELMHWHYLVGLLMVLLCGPVLTYLLHKSYTYRQPPR